MKPEPLKGKEKQIEMLLQGEYDEEPNFISREDSFFVKKDICSAVEWLKDEIVNKNYDGKTLIEIIDQAFEDVVKEKTNVRKK